VADKLTGFVLKEKSADRLTDFALKAQDWRDAGALDGYSPETTLYPRDDGYRFSLSEEDPASPIAIDEQVDYTWSLAEESGLPVETVQDMIRSREQLATLKRLEKSTDMPLPQLMQVVVAAERTGDPERAVQDFEQAMSEKGKIGFWEAFVNDPEKFVPLAGTLMDIGDLASIASAAKRLEANTYGSPIEERPGPGLFGGPYAMPGYKPPEGRKKFTRAEDQATINTWLEEQAEKAERGYSFFGRVGQITGEMPAYIADILLTKGLYTGTKLGVKALLKRGGKEVIERGAKAAIAKRGAMGLTAWAVASGVRAGIGTPHRVLETYLQHRLPENAKVDDDGNVSFAWPKEAPAMSMLKAWGDVTIELASEEAGAALTGGAGALARSVTKTRWGGKVLPKLFEGYRKLHPKTKWADFVRKATTTAGYHGILGELGEEYLGDQMRAIAALDDFGAGPNAGPMQRMGAAFVHDVKMTPEMFVSFLPVTGAAAVAEQIGGKAAPDGCCRRCRANRWQGSPHRKATNNGRDRRKSLRMTGASPHRSPGNAQSSPYRARGWPNACRGGSNYPRGGRASFESGTTGAVQANIDARSQKP